MLRAWLARLLKGNQAGAGPAADAEALVREALRARAAGEAAAAERLLYRALALVPESAAIHFHLGDLFRAQGRVEAALQCCEAGVQLAPDFPEGRNNLGSALRDAGRLAEAEAEYRRAAALDPRLPEARYNLGVLLAKRGDLAGAEAEFREAAALRPGFALAQLNLGFTLEERGEHRAAMQAYAAAVAADGGLVEAHVNFGMQLLLAGRYAEGWEEYEWRLRYPEYSGADAAARAPRWDGNALHGRTILLDAEQGFGDAIQFLRYAPLVAARGGRVIVRCAPELASLIAPAAGIASVVRRGEALPAIDAWCPLPSLPRAFGTTLSNVPADVPYVRADPEKAARWRARIAAAQGDCCVGLVWASQSGHRTASAKSVALPALAPLGLVPGVRLYGLQLGAAARDLQSAPAGMRLVDLSGELSDFAETAAAIQNLDLVISVDTAVAHLAGAMGRPVWTLLKLAPDWRWLLGREDSPWYPTMRLFRQERPGDWRAPVARLGEALRGFADARAGAAR